MTTTAVVAENLVAGLQALTWIALAVLAIFGTDWADPNAVSDWAALVTVLVIAAAYMFGVMTDRFADDVLLRLERLYPPKPVDKPADVVTMRMAVLAGSERVAKFLDYQRSRMRIARATVLNLPLLTVAIVWFLLARSDASSLEVLLTAIVGVVGTGLAFRVYRAIDCAYVSRLSDAYRAANGTPDAHIAAAICYRREGSRAEVGLVRTRDGDRWTFPKGHQEDGEALPETAAREAREEAGVRGRINGRRLISYRYPSTRPGEIEDDLVVGYLLKVKEVGKPTEGQSPTGLVWLRISPREAREGPRSCPRARDGKSAARGCEGTGATRFGAFRTSCPEVKLGASNVVAYMFRSRCCQEDVAGAPTRNGSRAASAFTRKQKCGPDRSGESDSRMGVGL